MDSGFKYDVALSLSDKDSEVADALYHALTSYSINLSVFYYKKEKSLGVDLKKKSLKVYMNQARHVVVLASKNYVTGEWADFEWKLVRVEEDNRPYRYILPIRIDEHPINGLSNDVIFEFWNDNACEIANTIKQVVDEDREKSQNFFHNGHPVIASPQLPPKSPQVTDEPGVVNEPEKAPGSNKDSKPGGNSKGRVILHWIRKFWWQLSILLAATLFNQTIIGWISPKKPDKSTPVGVEDTTTTTDPPTQPVPQVHSLKIIADGLDNWGVYKLNEEEPIAEIKYGEAMLNSIMVGDIIYLKTDTRTKRKLTITEEHIKAKEIAYEKK